jgi:hypothetical protein
MEPPTKPGRQSMASKGHGPRRKHRHGADTETIKKEIGSQKNRICGRLARSRSPSRGRQVPATRTLQHQDAGLDAAIPATQPRFLFRTSHNLLLVR